jgi:tight adherence protein C
VIALALLGLVLLGFAVASLTWAIVLPRARAVARIDQIASYGFPHDASGRVIPGAVRERRSPLLALSNRMGALLTTGSRKRYETWLRRQLVAAALYQVSARAVIGMQFIAGTAVLILLVGADVAGSLGKSLMFGLLMGAGAWVAPMVVVHGKARRRLDNIDRQVPDLIDMLVVTLEGGLGFGASLRAASTRMPAPVGDEIRLMMQEHSMGLTLGDSLSHLMGRIPTPNIQSFVRSVTQGETLGVSMGTIMRNLAVEMRVRRRQKAEEQAHKAPVKMLFPLIFLMFPALGIVILGPALFEITDSLTGLGQ